MGRAKRTEWLIWLTFKPIEFLGTYLKQSLYQNSLVQAGNYLFRRIRADLERISMNSTVDCQYLMAFSARSLATVETARTGYSSARRGFVVR